jgi:endonuclease III
MSPEKLKKLYDCIEKTVINESRDAKVTQEKIQSLDNPSQPTSDQAYYRILVTAIFHGSGIKAKQLEKVLTDEFFSVEVFSDFNKVLELSAQEREYLAREKIGYSQSLNRVFDSTVTFKKKIGDGTFHEYLATLDSPENRYKELKKNFKGLGKVSTYHFLKMCGFPTIKPDTVIARIFFRLGLISDQNDIDSIRKVGEDFVKATSHSYERVDSVLVKFGAEGSSDYLGPTTGVCEKQQPRCGKCQAKPFCMYKGN